VLALIEEVEKTNIVIVCLTQQARFVPCNSYTMKVDKKNRNYSNYRRFGYLVKNYRLREKN